MLNQSLRRVLLSSLPGTAATSIKIDGVQHEFSTIPGVKEDVTEIILNVKRIIAKVYSDTPKTVYIEANGAGEVFAKDIVTDHEIDIINGDLHIATLSEGAKLVMELTFDRGRGYVPVDRSKKSQEFVTLGVLPVDSIYTPVLKVNYSVENTRVGQITDFDKLTLDVYTNGTLQPDEAVSLAAKVLSEHLKLFIDMSDEAKNAEILVERPEVKKEKVLEMTIEELDLSARTANALLNNDIRTIRDLVTLSEMDLRDLKGFGQKALDEVKEKLTELNI